MSESVAIVWGPVSNDFSVDISLLSSFSAGNEWHLRENISSSILASYKVSLCITLLICSLAYLTKWLNVLYLI